VARFFSCDESNWPNFATLVTTDEFDASSNLGRDGVFRLNIGVSPATFDRLVGAQKAPDYTALDTIIPHPVYAAQQWIAVLNPSADTFERIKPLLAEAHERVAAKTKSRKAARPPAREIRPRLRPSRASRRRSSAS
jgi:predicted DNA-binding protein (MmcQ/YjbR family)